MPRPHGEAGEDGGIAYSQSTVIIGLEWRGPEGIGNGDGGIRIRAVGWVAEDAECNRAGDDNAYS